MRCLNSSRRSVAMAMARSYGPSLRVQGTFNGRRASAPLREATPACKRDDVFVRLRQQPSAGSRVALALATLWLAWLSPSQAATVTASVDRPAIALGEAVVLTVSLQGANVPQP